MTRLVPAAVAGACIALAVFAIASCSSVNNQRIGIDAPPYSQATFQPVGDFLVWRCGTNDCHGQPGRNFRVYGCDGMRLDAGTTVSCTVGSGGSSTPEEYVATYRSLVALEPQVMSTVFTGCSGATGAGGVGDYPPPPTCHPELLTLMAKARGTEKHKGGQLICLTPPCPPGIPPPNPNANPPVFDEQDQCLVTWLEGSVNVTACTDATFKYGLPVVDASTE